MPICNKPIIQFAVEEAVASGIEEVILVTRTGKSVLESYFAPAPDLEQFLQQQGRDLELQAIRRLSSMVRISTVQQPSPRGLGDALRCARSAVGNETFAVILPDAIIDARQPALAQLMVAYERYPDCMVATQPVPAADVSRFGMLAVAPVDDACLSRELFRVSSLVEKPRTGEAPSAYGIFGRYLLRPEIFDFLDAVPVDARGEIQLTEALAAYCRQAPLYGLCFDGTHFDAGDKTGYLEVNLHFGLKDPELASAIRRYLASHIPN